MLGSLPNSTPALRAGDPRGEPLEGELARFFEYSHDVLVIMDRAGRVAFVSPSVERVLGYSVEGILGQRVLDLVHPDDQSAVKAQARTVTGGSPIGDLDARISSADGTWVSMRWSLSVGLHQRVYAVGRDRTGSARHRDALLLQEMAELRLRTSMELHDGILQMLTGASLQIAAARKLLGIDPAAAEEVLEALGRNVAAEQQEMRLYVDELKGRTPVWTDVSLGLPERLEALLDRVGMIWGLTTSVEHRVTEGIGGELGRQILRIIQEAMVNAARHAEAKAVSVSVAVDGPDITISIADDGKGFSFLGEYDNDELKEKRLGPLSLKHRVEETGGLICINSTSQGSTVSVRIPLRPKERAE